MLHLLCDVVPTSGRRLGCFRGRTHLSRSYMHGHETRDTAYAYWCHSQNRSWLNSHANLIRHRTDASPHRFCLGFPCPENACIIQQASILRVCDGQRITTRKLETLTQGWLNVGPPSTTVANVQPDQGRYLVFAGSKRVTLNHAGDRGCTLCRHNIPYNIDAKRRSAVIRPCVIKNAELPAKLTKQREENEQPRLLISKPTTWMWNSPTSTLPTILPPRRGDR